MVLQLIKKEETMKTLKLLIAGMIFLIMSSSAWSYGSTGMWSSPDFFGNSYYSDSYGTTGSLSSPDFFGNSYFDFSNGSSAYWLYCLT